MNETNLFVYHTDTFIRFQQRCNFAFEKIMDLDFDKICRICLRFCKDYVDIRKADEAISISEKIRFCYYIQIDPREGLPTKVCYQCIEVLSLFYTAKKHASASDQILRNIIYIKHKLAMKRMHDDSINQKEKTKEKVNKSTSSPELLKFKKKGRLSIKNKRKREVIDLSNDSPKVEEDKNSRLSQLVNDSENKNGIENKELSSMCEQNHLVSKITKDEIVIDEEVIKEEDKKIVKVIGTVIDENNILSPEVKRTRKTILNKN